MNQNQRAIAEDKAGQEVSLAAHRAQFAKRIRKARRVEADIVQSLAACDQHHPILFKTYRTFSTLFESSTPVEDYSRDAPTVVHTWKVDELLPSGKVRRGAGRAELSSFCTVSDGGNRYSLNVVPRKAVIDMIGENMMLGDQYRIAFEVIVRVGGSALVTAHYNLISGSRWLAIVHSDTVPGARK